MTVCIQECEALAMFIWSFWHSHFFKDLPLHSTTALSLAYMFLTTLQIA